MIPQASDPESLQLFLLPPFTPADHYATLEVRIPADYLLFSSNLAVRARAVWGTEVYTDDSDIVGGVLCPNIKEISKHCYSNHSFGIVHAAGYAYKYPRNVYISARYMYVLYTFSSA